MLICQHLWPMTTGIRLGRHSAVGNRRGSSRSPQPIQASHAFCSLATHQSTVPARAMQCNSISAVRRRRRLKSGAQQTIEFWPGYVRYILDSYYDTLLLLSPSSLPTTLPSTFLGRRQPRSSVAVTTKQAGLGVWPQSRRKNQKILLR